MKVSVITISFNQVEFLARNRRSVAGQGPGVEHIIVDPGSTDGSREMVMRWAQNGEVIPIFQPDTGPADGLNHGLTAATGDVWLYLNADDELPPAAISRLRSLHAERPESDIVIGDGWTIDAEGRPIRRVSSDRFSPVRYAMSVGTVLQQATSFKAARTIGQVSFNPANRYNWDTEYLFDCYEAGLTFSYTKAELGYFRLHPTSITMSGDPRGAIKNERARLYARSRGRGILRVVSPVARTLKAALRTPERGQFPGLVE